MTEKELKWLEMYEHAKNYYMKYRELDIKKSYQLIYQDKLIYLGNWISRQRYEYKRGNLTYEQIQLLNEIDMIWDKSNHFTDNWNQRFELARQFYEIHGHLNIPTLYRVNVQGQELRYGTPEYDAVDAIKLGIWIINQRQAYKKIGNGKMTDEKKQLLNSIGMIWSIQELEWYRMYGYAKVYYEKYNHLNVHLHYRIDVSGQELSKENPDYASKKSIKLGQWISVQRLNRKNGTLENKYISLLDSIGMVWTSRKNKEEIRTICKMYGIDIKLNESILNKPCNEILAKIAFLSDIDEPIIIGNQLHRIFFMAEHNMQALYNISMEQLLNKYIDSKGKKVL